MKIQGHTDQVLSNILRINESSGEWEFANKLSTRICDITKQSAYLAYERWILLWPVIQLWLSSDSRVLSGIYSVAHLEGLSSEIMTHIEMKNNLQVCRNTTFDTVLIFDHFEINQLMYRNLLTQFQRTLTLTCGPSRPRCTQNRKPELKTLISCTFL